jgi:hypothetical protein
MLFSMSGAAAYLTRRRVKTDRGDGLSQKAEGNRQK